MSVLKIALTKGRLEKKTLAVLKKMGLISPQPDKEVLS